MKEILEKFKMESCNSMSTPVETSIKSSKEGDGQGQILSMELDL
jgi:hypothetical protein